MIPHINVTKYFYKSDKALVREINSKIDDNDPSGIRDIIDKAKKRKTEPDLVKEMESCLQEIELQKQKEESEARRKEDAKRKYIPKPPKLVERTTPSFPQKKRFAYNPCHTFKAVKEYSKNFPHDLYYITHFDNVPSIKKNGIFSRNLLAEQNIHPTDIGDQSVLDTRKCKACNDKNLWSYANVYFNPRNAMLYRIKNTYGWKTGILKVELDLNSPDLWITDGNAANNVTKFFPSDRRDEILPKIQKETIGVKWFNDDKEVERKVQAECIILKQINPNCIKSIHVSKNSNFINEWERLVKDSGLPVIPEEYMFFE
jgi:hypothetical protein